jgi:vacuolar-type H+-ATPase subunit I/STV1
METRHVFDPNHLGIQVYDLLSRPGVDDRERAKIIAEALETVQQNYPDLGNTATKRDLSETELRLMAEIEKTRERIEKTNERIEKTNERIEILRGETKEIELRLMAEIEKTRLDIKDVELRLTKEIESVRVDLTKEIESVRTDLTKEMGKQTMRTVTYLTAIMGLFYAIVRFVPA